MIEFLTTGPVRPVARLLLAHGAGAPMDSPFMTAFAELMAAHDVAVSRFEFDYMAARRTGGKKRPAPKAESLMDAYRSAIATVPGEGPLFVGGKSMGGRVASLVADGTFKSGAIQGLICLGYPFHPPTTDPAARTASTPRIAHLAMLDCPTMIVQGERDPFGTRSEVDAMHGIGVFSEAIAMHWIGDGDHDFGPRGGKGFTRKGNLAAAAEAVARFIGRVVQQNRS